MIAYTVYYEIFEVQLLVISKNVFFVKVIAKNIPLLE